MYYHTEIEKCKHCKGKGVLKGRKHYRVVCTVCGAQGPTKNTPSKAVKAWNQSADEDQSNE